MRLVIDRIEGRTAVCEDDSGNRHEFSVTQLPEGACEGSVLKHTDGRLSVDAEATQKRREYMQRLMDDVFE